MGKTSGVTASGGKWQKMEPLKAVAINKAKRFIRLEDDTTLPIVALLAADGEETENMDECIIALFQLPDKMYSGVDIRRFDADMQETTQ